MRADLGVGLDFLLDDGWSVLRPSRPGYGGTPLAAGPDAPAFCDRVASLCGSLGFRELCAFGISAGGRTALTLAARHPDLVRGVVLESSISFAPWPDRPRRYGASLVFGPGVERVVWASLRGLFRLAPAVMLRAMMSSLSDLPGAQVVAGLSASDRAALVDTFRQMRSGRGFANDLLAVADVSGEVGQPVLVVASLHDGAVSPEHSRRLAAQLADARLVLVEAESHLLWFGPHADQGRAAVHEFLDRL